MRLSAMHQFESDDVFAADAEVMTSVRLVVEGVGPIGKVILSFNMVYNFFSQSAFLQMIHQTSRDPEADRGVG